MPGPPGECRAAPRQDRPDQCSFEIGFKNLMVFHDTAQPGWRTGPTRPQALRGGVAGSAAGSQPGEAIEALPQGSITPMASSMQDMRTCSIHVAPQDENSQVSRFSRSPVSPFPRFPVFPFPRVPVFPFSRFPVSPFSRFPVFPFFLFSKLQPGEVIEVLPQRSITPMASSMQDMRACSIHVASQG